MSESPDPAAPAADSADFESALKELESLVETLERGELSLEASLEAFERGVALTRYCQTALREAEQRVAVLTGEEDTERLEPFAEEP
jgi:exodeoxyribonuclease VII small subunit